MGISTSSITVSQVSGRIAPLYYPGLHLVTVAVVRLAGLSLLLIEQPLPHSFSLAFRQHIQLMKLGLLFRS